MKNCISLFSETGNWYKINLHTHSTVSDGNFTPAELKSLYMSKGYSAVAFTDHRICMPHGELTDGSFVALTGAELDFSRKSGDNQTEKVVHLNVLFADPSKSKKYDGMIYDYDIINGVINDLKKEDCLVTLNHPVWSNMSTEELEKIEGYDAMEVFNSISVTFNNYADDSAFYEWYLRRDGKAIPVAGDDSHRIFDNGTPFVEYFKSFTMVKAESLSYEAIFNALKCGNCYASTGPEFYEMWLEGDILHVKCSPVSGVFVHSKYISCKKQIVERDDTLTHIEIDVSDIRKCSPYLWVQLRNSRGEKAWATPYWF